MRHPSLRTFLVACLATLALPLAAHAGDDIQVNLTAHRITTGAAGKEILASADHAKPGDVIEYRAVYANQGHGGVRQMVATLPIPAGMQYVPGTAVPGSALASLDGQHFDVIPLKRRVRLADGSEALREVPVDEYRYLRWGLGDIAAGQSETVRARVRVNPGAGPVSSVTTGGTTH
ncbi:MAG: hypothetical protein ACHQ52_07505 [Candidatus Eisenbacteria bacterium]